MQVWLVDDKRGDNGGSLETVLRQLERRPHSELRLVGASPFQSDFTAAMSKLVPDLLDLIVVHEPAWPDGPWTEEVLQLHIGLAIVTTPDRAARFQALAEAHPIVFVPSSPDPETLWLGLLGAWTSVRRQLECRRQLERLEQRLQDRIVIERAKGILVKRLGISEEDAYKRLRLQSRRQRRQIRDIAQSLLDTQVLFLPDSKGLDACERDPVENGHATEVAVEGVLSPES